MSLKITSIEPQVKNPKRFNIFIDNKFAFGADEDLVVDHRLIPGKQIETADLEKLLFEAEVGKLVERIYGLLSVRIRSEKEIRDYLRNLSYKRQVKGREEISQASVELLVDRLKQKGLINDQEFAQVWVESRRNSKKKGAKALKMELFQKGIDREVIDRVIGEQVTSDSETDLARQAMQKKLKSWQNLLPLEFKKKAYEYLARRGFDYSVIEDVVKEFRKTQDFE